MAIAADERRDTGLMVGERREDILGKGCFKFLGVAKHVELRNVRASLNSRVNRKESITPWTSERH